MRSKMIKFSAYLIGDQRKRLVKQTNSVYKKRREHRIKRLEKIKVYKKTLLTTQKGNTGTCVNRLFFLV